MDDPPAGYYNTFPQTGHPLNLLASSAVIRQEPGQRHSSVFFGGIAHSLKVSYAVKTDLPQIAMVIHHKIPHVVFSALRDARIRDFFEREILSLKGNRYPFLFITVHFP